MILGNRHELMRPPAGHLMTVTVDVRLCGRAADRIVLVAYPLWVSAIGSSGPWRRPAARNAARTGFDAHRTARRRPPAS